MTNSPTDAVTGRSPRGSRVVPAAEVTRYADGRPGAKYRLDAVDQGVVLRHGHGPDDCDVYGAREALVFEHGGTYYLHYDGAGPTGWLACLATSPDLVHWDLKGPVLELGAPGEPDSASASSPWVYYDGAVWHMFYVCTARATPPPDLIPAVPYETMKATSASPAGPWVKRRGFVPLRAETGTYHADTASPGHVIAHNGEFLMFFSAASVDAGLFTRTLGIARTHALDGPWTPDPTPIVPLSEQIENSSLYFEPSSQTWFLFTNHIGLDGEEYTDALWVYWSRDVEHWDPEHKAVVLDGANCAWSRRCLGLPSVVPVGDRLAILYDGPGGQSTGHMRRDVGLAWLDLPLRAPADE